MGVAAHMAFHFQQREIVETVALQPPSGGQSGDAAAGDQRGDFYDFAGRRGE